ncbi:hypothetical protein HanXRQr2_Chr05g0227221 [Helianthus annuus]|uniref:Uncharacterized protein n=1 Tax=Helianthus annuus TaxID=4232 RepID=A0A9K3J190_HELAN|nr:hypothetical protein HanXRQr2_Chr05g0227221 [Helianthus annuus]KAJ0923709.1 hypothetical protein HanPSC8_Chr05g0219231 [Helianthus annuus]
MIPSAAMWPENRCPYSFRTDTCPLSDYHSPSLYFAILHPFFNPTTPTVTLCCKYALHDL